MTAPRLLVLNPNRSAWMTERVAEQVRRHAGGAVDVVTHTCDSGPEVIDSRDSFDAGAVATRHALHALRQHKPTAVLLACFGDPGLEALRDALQPIPVQGLASAAMALAVSRRQRFAILTSGPAWVGLLHERAEQWGYAPWLVAVHALPINGAQWAAEPARWQPALQAAADRAAAQGAQALILGGAAFAGFERSVTTPLVWIDAVEAATWALMRELGHR